MTKKKYPKYSTNTYKTVPNFPNVSVNEAGTSITRFCQPLERVIVKGKPYILIDGKKYLLKRLVASAHLPNPNPRIFTEVVCRDGNEKNCGVDNLIWADSDMIKQYRKLHRSLKREMELEDEVTILNLHDLGFQPEEIAQTLNLKRSDVVKTINKAPEINLEDSQNDTVREYITQRLKNGTPPTILADITGLPLVQIIEWGEHH